MNLNSIYQTMENQTMKTKITTLTIFLAVLNCSGVTHSKSEVDAQKKKCSSLGGNVATLLSRSSQTSAVTNGQVSSSTNTDAVSASMLLYSKCMSELSDMKKGIEMPY